MFARDVAPPDPTQWLVRIEVTFEVLGGFEELSQYYRSDTNPTGLDPAAWRVTGADANGSMLLQTLGDTDYQTFTPLTLVIAEDRSKPSGSEGKYTVLRIESRPEPSNSGWYPLLESYAGGCSDCAATSRPAALVTRLRDAYATRNPALYEELFHSDFLFVLPPDPLHPEQPTSWSRTEEVRLHRRMFEPQNISPSEPPIDPALWLIAIDITLTQAGPFVELPEFYVSPSNPSGLDPSRWKVVGTDYHASVLFRTRGETDYQVIARQSFVVAEDLSKHPWQHGAFSLYRWQEHGSEVTSSVSSPAVPWFAVKNLYR